MILDKLVHFWTIQLDFEQVSLIVDKLIRVKKSLDKEKKMILDNLVPFRFQTVNLDFGQVRM